MATAETQTGLTAADGGGSAWQLEPEHPLGVSVTELTSRVVSLGEFAEVCEARIRGLTR
jgi:hypothetical protein